MLTDLKKLFAANAEHIFVVDLGVPDPRLIDYIVDLLVKFIKTEALYQIGNHKFKKITEVFNVEDRVDLSHRDIYKHIGDLSLFWDGFYPTQKCDYRTQGKLSYHIASTYDDCEYKDEVPVLKRLSENFEICSIGLNKIRQECNNL